MDPNEDFDSFDFQLINLVGPKLPKGLMAHSDRVNISYQRAYITKAQERKRKDLPWKEFADNDDYLGLINAIRSCSKPYMITVMIRAFITVPKENFDTEIEPVIASHRFVYRSSFGLKLTVVICYFSAEAGTGVTPTRSAYCRIPSPSNTMEMYYSSWEIMLQIKRTNRASRLHQLGPQSLVGLGHGDR